MSSHFKALAKRLSPETIPLFPLDGTVLLPGCDLPLNIFEPRYLNMVDDALRADRLIGMTQPCEDADATSYGGLYQLGGLGRIIQFSEVSDGRYMIVLRGLKRFKIIKNVQKKTPYAQARVSFEGFDKDINILQSADKPEALSAKKGARSVLTMAMKSYAKTLGVRLDWDALKEIQLDRLVDQTAMISPFGAADKQSLLEAENHEDRRRLLIGLMHLHSTAPDGDMTH